MCIRDRENTDNNTQYTHTQIITTYNTQQTSIRHQSSVQRLRKIGKIVYNESSCLDPIHQINNKGAWSDHNRILPKQNLIHEYIFQGNSPITMQLLYTQIKTNHIITSESEGFWITWHAGVEQVMTNSDTCLLYTSRCV